MLLQSALDQRIIIVLILQVWPIFYASFFAYKMLKRAKNRSTFILSSYFIMGALTYFFVGISFFFLNTPLAYFFYILGIYFFIFGHCIAIIFSWVLVKLDDKSPYWKFHLVVTFYGFISTYVLIIGFFFSGIKYDASINWIPRYSWFFLIFSWIFLSIFLVIPQIYFSIKILKVFEGVILKHRINLFLISVFFELIMVFALFLYHTWLDNQVYRTIYLFIFPPLGTIAAYLIYKSFGKELE